MTFQPAEHPRDRRGEFARGGEYDRILSTQRAVEGTRAALKDPGSNAVYTGLTHADAFRKAPPDAQVRMRPYINDGSFDRASIAGFLDEDGDWMSRAEASRKFGGINGGRATAEAISQLKTNPHDIISAFHAQDAEIERAAQIALDKAMSSRSYDSVGRLHVSATPISKACVNPYIGNEIPHWKEMGLDPARVYRLLRHPDELEKAAGTFNNIPVLREHVPVTADAPRPDLVVGGTGTDAKFKHPYLWNSFAVWHRDKGIDGVEDESKKALSAAYSYDPDMTPGVFEGQPYDGVMRNIRGNHLCLVKDGRAGPEIVVGDSMEKITMAKATLSRAGAMAYDVARVRLAPLLAHDAQIDMRPAFAKFTFKDPGSSLKALSTILDGHLQVGVPVAYALDDVSAGLRALLEALGGGGEAVDAGPLDPVLDPAGGGGAAPPDPMLGGGGAPPPPADLGAGGAPPAPGGGMPPPAMDPGAAPPSDAGAGGVTDKLRAFLGGILTPEQMQQLEAIVGEADEEDAPEGGGEGGPGEGGAAPAAPPGGTAPKPKEPAPPPDGAKPPGGAEKKPPAPKEAAPGGGAPPAKKPDGAQDAPPRTKGTPRVGGAMDEDDNMGNSTAMDAAIKIAIANNDKRHAAIAAARDLVRPLVGDLSMAADSANDILKAALRMKGVDPKQLSLISETPALEMLVRNMGRSSSPSRTPRVDNGGMAQDAANPLSFEKFYPGVKQRISVR